MAAATLNARPRTERGKGAARTLRREGLIPAVVYGHGEESLPLTVDALELEKLLASINVENTIVDLQIEGSDAAPALIREVQYHPAKARVLHVDFFHVHAGETLHLDIPIRLHGAPVGVRENGGVLQEVLRDLRVECLPKDIPEGVDLDVTDLDIGGSVHVSDITLPNVKILNDPDLVICTITAPSVAALPETPEEEETAVGDVEPELIRSRTEDADGVPTTEQGGTTS